MPDRDAGESEITPWRVSAFAAVLGCMLAGPLANHGVLGSAGGLLHGWTMFSGRGVGDMDVDYIQVLDGERTKLAWGRMLLDDGRREQLQKHTRDVQHSRRPLSRAMTTVREVVGEAARICKLLPEGAELHARLRRATMQGWDAPRAIERNLCDPKVQRELIRPPRKRHGGKGKAKAKTKGKR